MAKRVAKNRAAVDAARKRRGIRKGQSEVEVEWFIENVVSKVELTMQQRVRIATQFLQNKIVRNISRPVTKTSTGKSRDTKGKFLKQSTRVTNRSKSGEFPKADTTQLMKSIFTVVGKERKGVFDGFVGTNLDYGLILEITKRLNRSFLVRSLNENVDTIRKILTGPIK